MYQILIFCHSIVRWLVLASLLFAIFRSYKGHRAGAVFQPADDAMRHRTATIAHIQMMIGFILYFQSPLIKYFWQHFKELTGNREAVFFSLVHMLLMLTAVIVITIGSALAKRQVTDRLKFRIMFLWFSIALFIILLAVPWPFSPLASRPLFRHY